MGGGDDHRPGRGSELLRRRFPRQASSSSSGCAVYLLLSLAPVEVTLSSAAVLRWSGGGGGGGDGCCCCWFESSPLLLREETEDRRWMRILGRRARDRVRCRCRLGCTGASAAAGVKWEEEWVVVGSPVPSGRSSGPRTGSMRSIEGRAGKNERKPAEKKESENTESITLCRDKGKMERLGGENGEKLKKKKKRGEGKESLTKPRRRLVWR